MLDRMSSALAEQDGVLASRQADQIWGRAHVRAQVAAHRWQRPARGVVVTHNGPLTEAQRTWVSLLSCPPASALTGLTAAAWDGLEGFVDDQHHIAVPCGTRRSHRRHLCLHLSTQLDAADVHPLRVPRRTRLPRAIVDAASEQVSEQRARAVVLASVQQRLVRPTDLRRTVDRRGECRRRALIAETIADAAGGIHSLPERELELIRRRRRLPRPTRQQVRPRRDGHYFLDNEWEEYDVAAEVHGVPHMLVAQWDRDTLRQNEIVIVGPRLLVFTSYAVRRMQQQVGDQLERALRRGGWSP